jgi:hypothetical protein
MNKELSEPISEMIVQNKLNPGQVIELDIEDGNPIIKLITADP